MNFVGLVNFRFPVCRSACAVGGVDLRLDALHAARKDPACGELGIRGVSIWLTALPAEDADLNLLGDSARLYFAVAREAEAEGRIY
jgi:hypothetical protein